MINTAYVLFGIYLFGMVYIAIFCLMQLYLLVIYIRKKFINNEEIDNVDFEDEKFPFVTIQLPIFNEKYVVERLIDNIVKMDYPKDKFEIHILDDSNDETLEICKRSVVKYQQQGYNIEQIIRKNRVGYKAGALKEGMKVAKGDYIAIFDADFLPKPEFLMKTIPYFNNEEIGVVQTRWAHINQDYSLITELQAFQLNVHFTIEQVSRTKSNYFLQFNGTGGVWRRQAIDEAGGWEADTLTEDLDLSYRAQMKGWKIKYLEEVVSPAELPIEMSGLKSQQHRWMKGGAENARKLLPTVWKTPSMSFVQKIHATNHLMSSTIFLIVFLVAIISVPLLYFFKYLDFSTDFLAIFMISLLSIVSVYFVANVITAWENDSLFKKMVKFVFLFPLFLALSMGLSLHNSIAVLQGFRGKKSAFVRTPKFNIKSNKDKLKKNDYVKSRIPIPTYMEGLLALYFLAAFGFGLYYESTVFIIFHFLLMIGFGTIFIYSVKALQYRVN